MQNALKLYIVLYLFLTQDVCTKSLANKDINRERNVDSKAENEDLPIEDGIASEHDSLRSKHRHKSGARHREMSKRHSAANSEENEEPRADCAVMYKNNEPVGILQPFEDSYKFLPICGDSTLVDINAIPNKRKTMMDMLYPNVAENDYDDTMTDDKEASSEGRMKREETGENTIEKAKFDDDKFPYLLAKFKIDSRLDNLRNPLKDLTPSKRAESGPALDDKQVGSLKSTLSKMRSDDSEAVEEELRGILDQMGLIDDEPKEDTEVKREVEDENLETGTNNIEMIKEEPAPTRSKREETNTKETTLPKTEEKPSTENPGYAAESPISIILRKRAYTTAKTTETPCMEEKREIGLEGFSTASYDSTPSLMDDQLTSYEKRVEREIRDKIQRLKEEVKKEIEALKTTNSKKAVTDRDDRDDSKRRKRQVGSTLIDEETEDIDPMLNDEESKKVHVRRKRSLEDSKPTETSDDSGILHSSSEPNYIGRRLKGIWDATTQEALSRFERDNFEGSSTQEGRSRFERDDADSVTTEEARIRFRRGDSDDAYVEDSEYEEGDSREKREDANDEEDGEYEYDEETQFADGKDNQAFDKRSDEREKKESYESSKKCKCGKNGCKCGLDDVPKSNIIHDYSNVGNVIFDYTNFMVDPEIVERDLARGMSKHSDLSKVVEEDIENYDEEDDSGAVDKRSVDKDDGGSDTIPSQPRLWKRRDVPNAFRQNEEGDEYVNGFESGERESKREVKPRRLKPFENGEYFVDLHPEMYRLSPIEDNDADTTVALHGAARSHRPSSKRRRGIPQAWQKHHRIRRTIRNEDDNREPMQLIDMSEEDLFGALPQSYEGELARYKRVKRKGDRK